MHGRRRRFGRIAAFGGSDGHCVVRHGGCYERCVMTLSLAVVVNVQVESQREAGSLMSSRSCQDPSAYSHALRSFLLCFLHQHHHNTFHSDRQSTGITELRSSLNMAAITASEQDTQVPTRDTGEDLSFALISDTRKEVHAGRFTSRLSKGQR